MDLPRFPVAASAMTEASRTSPDLRVWTRLGGRFGRHTLTYGAGSFLTLASGLVSVGVLTRLLDPSEYGQLAILLIFSSLLSVLYTLGVLQGAYSWVYGGSDEDGIEDTGDPGAGGGREQRRALGTGLCVITLFALAGSGLLLAFHGTVATLIGTPRSGAAYGWAVAAGAGGAVWRYVHNIPRLERFPTRYVALSVVRPALVLALSIVLVAAGHGLAGALAGVASGTLAATLVGLVVVRRSVLLALSPAIGTAILRRGAAFIPMILALWILHHADTWVLSRSAADSKVGIYRVASRAGAFMSYFVAAFLMTWGPLSRTSLFGAAKRDLGPGHTSAVFLAYFALAAFWLLLVLALGADVLVRIASPEYRAAADLIPIIGMGFCAYGAFVLVYRLGRFPRKRTMYTGTTLLAAATLVLVSAVLVPPLGSYGAAIATIVASGLGTACLLALSQRGAEPLPLQHRRMLTGLLVALACFGLARLLGEVVDRLAPLVDVAAVLAYPVLLVAAGSIPRSHLESLRAIAASIAGRAPRNDLHERLRELPAEQRGLLEALAFAGRPLGAVALERGVDPDRLGAEGVEALRSVAGVESATRSDAHLGRYLFAAVPVAERDAVARKIWSDGLEPAEIDALEACLEQVRRLDADAWADSSADRLTRPPRRIVLLSGRDEHSGKRAAGFAAAAAGRGLELTVVRTPGPVARLLQVAVIRRRIRRSRPHVIHAQGPGGLRIARRVARRAGSAVVYDLPRSVDRPRSRPGRWRELRMAASADVVVAGSERAAAALATTGPVPPFPCVVRDVPAAPAAARARSRLRDSLGIGAEFLVMSDGRDIDPGLSELVIGAAARVADLHLLLVGRFGPQESERLRLLGERMRMSDRLHLIQTPSAERMAAYAREADAGLVVSSDALELVTPELMRFLRAGLPVLAADGSEAAHVVSELGAGWTTPPNGRALVQAFATLRLEAADIRRDGSDLGSLSATATAKSLAAVYERAVAERGHPWPAPRRSGSRTDLRDAATRVRGMRPTTLISVLRVRRASGRGGSAGDVTALERGLRAPNLQPRDALRLAAALKTAGEPGKATEAYAGLAALSGGAPLSARLSAAVGLARLGARERAEEVIAPLIAAGPGSQPPRTEIRIAEVLAALDELGAARERVLTAFRAAPAEPGVAEAAARVLDLVGEPSAGLEAARLAGAGDRVRRLAGMRRVLDADWRPTAQRHHGSPVDPRRVIHLLETSLPHAGAGYSHRSVTVLDAQRRAGYDPVAVTRLGFPVTRGARRFGSVELVAGTPHHRYVLPGVTHYTSIPPDELAQRHADAVAPLARHAGAAVVQAHTPHFNGLAGLAVADALDLPLIYDVRGFPEMTWAVRAGGDRTEVWDLRRQAETRCMREADAVCALSEVMRQEIIGRGVAAECVFVVPHGVDTGSLRPGAARPELLRRYGLEGSYVVGYIGSLLDYEGVDTLVHAVGSIRRQRADMVALIVGNGAHLPELRRLTEELGLSDAVRFTGRVPFREVRDHYELLDVVVCPRHDHEVCRLVTPLKPYEVMAMGGCLVVSDLPALMEPVRDGDTGRAFEAGDAGDLARVLLELAADPDQRQALGERGRAYVEEAHSPGAVAAAADSVLRLVLGSRTTHGPHARAVPARAAEPSA